MKSNKINTDTGVSVVVMMVFGLVTVGGMLAATVASGSSSRRHPSDRG